MAGLGQWGAPQLAGSVDKLIDFISVSHTTSNPYWPDIHMFTVQRIMLLPSSVLCFFFFSSFNFSFLRPHFSCFTVVFLLLCFVYFSFTLYLPPWLHPSFSPFKGSILYLASVPVSVLVLPLGGDWWAGGRAEEPLFSRPFFWMKRWNKGMKALGKVWKLPIHQCKEILR